MVANEAIQEIQAESPQLNEIVSPVRKKRIRGRELVQLYNEAAASPLSNEGSRIASARPSSFRNQQMLKENKGSSESQSDSEISLCSTETSSNEYLCPSEENPVAGEAIKFSSQTINESFVHPQSSSTLNSEPESPHCSSNIFLEPSSYIVSEKLYEGSQISVDDAKFLVEFFCSRFNLSDECSSSLHLLIRTCLPLGNKFPSEFSFVQKMNKSYEEELFFSIKTETESFCVLNIRSQLGDIIERHFMSISGSPLNVKRTRTVI